MTYDQLVAHNKFQRLVIDKLRADIAALREGNKAQRAQRLRNARIQAKLKAKGEQLCLV